MSNAVIEERFEGTRPENFAELRDGLGEAWADFVPQFVGTNSGKVLRKDDLSLIWDSLVQDEYGVPPVAAEAEGIWPWDDVTYIVVQPLQQLAERHIRPGQDYPKSN